MKDLIGLKVGKLEVKKYLYYNGRHHYWECLCECGKSKKYHSGHLLAKTLRSCGCEKKKSGSTHMHFKGCGDLSLALYNKWKANAKRRKIEFCVDIKFLWKLLKRQDFKCALTGLELTLPKSTRDFHKYFYNISLDRIDSKIGYLRNNVQFVIKDVNMMKQQFSQDYFFSLCKLVVENKEQK